MNRVVPLLAGLAILCATCAPQIDAPPAPRLVLLYATCTVNKNYLEPYNEQRFDSEPGRLCQGIGGVYKSPNREWIIGDRVSHRSSPAPRPIDMACSSIPAGCRTTCF